MKARAKIFVISAPSGGGKTTLCKRLLDEGLDLADSVSMTTRPPRESEKDGVDYRFVSRKYFEEMIKKDEFLEYEDNFGQLYGTPKRFVDDNLKKGKSVLLSIDVKGAMKVRRAYPKNSVLIFILPPSLDDLEKRLANRRSDSTKEIASRLNLAKREMAYKSKYNYRIVNDELDGAHKKLKDVIISEMSS